MEEANGRPIAVFDDEPAPRNWLLASLLEEARTILPEFLAEIESAQSGKSGRFGITGDAVDVEFYPDRAVIKELWPDEEEDDEPERVELPLDQVRQLLIDWQAALDQWRSRSTKAGLAN